MKPVSVDERRRPDDEDLAAFCEGCLAEPMRRAVIERLATDADYYRVYVDFQHLLGTADVDILAVDSDTVEADDAPEISPRAVSWRRWIGPGSLIAAVLILAVFGPLLISRPPPTLAELAAGLDASRAELRQAPGPTFLGPEDARERLTLDAATSFHLGSLLLDLELAVAAGQNELAEQRRRAITRLLDGSVASDFWRPPVAGQAFADEITSGRMANSFSLAYGIWARGLWLAVRADNIDYVSGRGVRRGAAWLHREAPRELRPELRRLRGYLDEPDLEALDRELRRVAAARESDFEPPLRPPASVE